MATGGDRQLRLEVSPSSLRSANRLNQSLAQSRAEAAELLSLFKGLSDVSKQFRAQGMMQGTPGGGSIAAMMEGERLRGAQRRQQLAFEGSSAGRRLANQQEYNKLAKQGLRYLEQQKSTMEAQNLSARTKTATLQKITNLQEAQNRKMAVEKRLGQEALTGKRSSVKAFERQRDALSQVITRLREEKKLNEQIARARTRNPELERAQTDRSRRLKMQGLFGDGGASLFAVQAGISANYMALNGVRGAATETARFSADLDEAMRNLQAITVTTEGDLQRLKTSLVDISEQTKFTAVEVANAAVTLGQAGLSIQEIEKAVPAVALLATATGTDLARAVDIATATLGVFRMESSQMAHVANTMTAAVNQSKLNIEKLTLGLQYSGNIAAQSGVRFEELTSALGAMANAGIRSGSTLGTGMRQILISLQKPSKEFMKILGQLGLSMHDVDVGSQGLYGALKNLRDAGFSSGDAIRSFRVRAAAAFNALSNNLDSVLDLEKSFLNSSAAMKANETQMEALNNQAKRAGSVWKSVAEVAFEPFVILTRDILRNLGDLGSVLKENETLVKRMGTALVGLSLGGSVLMIGRLAKGLLGLTGVLGAVTKGAGKLGAGAALVTTRFGRLGGVITSVVALFARLAGPIGWLATGAAIVGSAFFSMRSEAAKAKEEMDKLQTSFNRAKGEMEETADQIASVTDEIAGLTEREEALMKNQEMLDATVSRVREQFASMGLDLDKAKGSVENVRDALKDLRSELAEDYIVNIRVAQNNLEDVIEGRMKRAAGYRAQIGEQASSFRESTGGKISAAARSILEEAQNPDMSPVELRQIGSRITLRQQQLEDFFSGGITGRDRTAMRDEISRSGGEAGRYFREEQALLELLKPVVDDLRTTTAALVKDQGEKERLGTEALRSEQENTQRMQTIRDGLTATRTGVKSDFAMWDDDRAGKTLSEQLSGARGIVRERSAELDEYRRAIEASPFLEEGLAEEILNQINNVERDMLNRLVDLKEQLSEESAELGKGEVKRIGEQISALQDKLRDPEADVTSIHAELVKLMEERFRTQLELIENDSETTLAVRRQQKEDLRRGFNQDLTNLGMEAGETQGDQRVAGLNRERRAIEVERDLASDRVDEAETPAEIRARYKERLRLEQELHAVKRQIAVEEAETDAEEKIRLKELRAEFETTMRALDQGRSDALEELEEERLRVVRENARRFEALEENEEKIEAARRVLEQARADKDTALARKAQEAIDTLEDEYDEILDIEGRLGGLSDTLEAARPKLAKIPTDDRGAARAAIREMAELLETAKRNAEDLNNVDITEFENKFDQLNATISRFADKPLDIAAIYGQYQRSRVQSDRTNRSARLSAARDSGILDLIAEAEGTAAGSNPGARGYNTTLDYGRWTGGEQNLVNMTLDQIVALQKQMLSNPENLATYDDGVSKGSSALGRYQIVGKTLRGLIKDLDLSGDERFSAELQDQLAMELIRQQGLDADGVQRVWEGLRKVPTRDIQTSLGQQTIPAEFTPPSGGATANRGNPFDTRMDNYEAGFTRYNASIRSGAMSARAGVGGMETIVADAQRELEERATKLEEISQVSNRTKEQEEKRLRLAREHNQLLSFIENKEEAILTVKREQGLAAIDIKRTVKEWADTNLNLGEGFGQGLTSVLSSTKNAFTELFTTLSNGTKTGKEAFADLARGVIKSIQGMIAEMLAMYTMQKLLGLVFPGSDFGKGSLSQIAGTVLGTSSGKPAADGEIVRGTNNRDTEHYRLMDGEAVLRRSAVQAIGEDEVRKMNALGNRQVSESPARGAAQNQRRREDTGDVNVYVVSPDQKPSSLGPKDIVAVVSDDIQRGGTLRKHIATVSKGGDA